MTTAKPGKRTWEWHDDTWSRCVHCGQTVRKTRCCRRWYHSGFVKACPS